MAVHPLLGIFLIGIIFSSSMTAGYNQMMEPLHGRTFSLFNLLPLQRVSSAQFAGLVTRLATVEANLASLTTQISASAEKCPPSSLGSQLIGTFCYSVTGATVANRKNYAGALAACQKAGGSLAEPQITRAANANLYNAIKAKFPDSFKAIENTLNGGKFWIGYYDRAAAPPAIISATTKVPVPNPDDDFPPNADDILLPAPLAANAILLNKPAVPIAAYWTQAPIADLNPFICQFTALA